MRKKIEVNKKEVNNKQEEKSNMEKILDVYQKLSARVKFSYDKEIFNDKEKLDYQECLNEVMVEILESKEVIEKPANYIRRAIANRMKDRYKKNAKLDLTDSNFEDEIFCFPLGEVIEAKKVIEKILTIEEKICFDMYNDGFTYEEIAKQNGFDYKTQAKRIVDKAYKKIESIHLRSMFDIRFTSYNPKNGNTIDKYIEVKENPGEVIKRKYCCLDQEKSKVKTIKENYDANTCPIRQDFEVKLSLVSYASHIPYGSKYMVYGATYQKSKTEISNNKEYIQLMTNRAIYQKQNTRVIEKRSKPVFARGRYIAGDKYFTQIYNY